MAGSLDLDVTANRPPTLTHSPGAPAARPRGPHHGKLPGLRCARRPCATATPEARWGWLVLRLDSRASITHPRPNVRRTTPVMTGSAAPPNTTTASPKAAMSPVITLPATIKPICPLRTCCGAAVSWRSLVSLICLDFHLGVRGVHAGCHLWCFAGGEGEELLVFVLAVDLEHAAQLSPGVPGIGSGTGIVPAPAVSANSSRRCPLWVRVKGPRAKLRSWRCPPVSVLRVGGQRHLA